MSETSDVADALARQVEAQASTDPFGVRLRRALREAVEYGYAARRLEEPRPEVKAEPTVLGMIERGDAIAAYLTALADALEPTQKADPAADTRRREGYYDEAWESSHLRQVAGAIAKRATGLRALAGVTVPQP